MLEISKQELPGIVKRRKSWKPDDQISDSSPTKHQKTYEKVILLTIERESKRAGNEKGSCRNYRENPIRATHFPDSTDLQIVTSFKVRYEGEEKQKERKMRFLSPNEYPNSGMERD